MSDYEPAVHSSALLCHLADVGRGIESLRCYIRAIGPADGGAGNKEFAKVGDVAERLEDGPLQPGLEVYGLRGPVVEREVDTMATTVLGLYDTWENRHVRVPLFQRRDLSQRLAGP